MCGRYNLVPDAAAWADLGEVLGSIVAEELSRIPARYNVAPTQTVPIIVEADDGTAQLIDARWGFIPHWWKGEAPPPKTTNARSETAPTKPMWRHAWRNQRCLIPASNWFEWFAADEGKSKVPKIPHLIERTDGKQILFAGLWSWSPPTPDGSYPTCAIVTLPSAPDIAEIHERTPVVLDPKHWKMWLDRSLTDSHEISRIAAEGAVEQFSMHTVSLTVSRSRTSGRENVEPAEFPEMAAQGKAAYQREQLVWLRESSAPDLLRSLFERLEAKGAEHPNRAERRLWLRELADRDDAEAFSELAAAIRLSLRREADSVRPPPPGEPPRQGGLF